MSKQDLAKFQIIPESRVLAGRFAYDSKNHKYDKKYVSPEKSNGWRIDLDASIGFSKVDSPVLFSTNNSTFDPKLIKTDLGKFLDDLLVSDGGTTPPPPDVKKPPDDLLSYEWTVKKQDGSFQKTEIIDRKFGEFWKTPFFLSDGLRHKGYPDCGDPFPYRILPCCR